VSADVGRDPRGRANPDRYTAEEAVALFADLAESDHTVEDALFYTLLVVEGHQKGRFSTDCLTVWCVCGHTAVATSADAARQLLHQHRLDFTMPYLVDLGMLTPSQAPVVRAAFEQWHQGRWADLLKAAEAIGATPT
jgi:hypothetical protein